MKCLEAFHPSPTLSLYCIQSPPPRYTTRRKNKKKLSPRLPRSKKHHALDIDIYTYVTAQAPPPKGVPPAPPIVKMGCHGRNHGSFFLGRFASPMVGVGRGSVGHGRSVRNRSYGRGVCGPLRISNFVRNWVYRFQYVMTGHSAGIRLRFNT